MAQFVVGDTVQAISKSPTGKSYVGKVVCVIPAGVYPTTFQGSTYGILSTAMSDRFVIEYGPNQYATIPLTSSFLTLSKVSSPAPVAAPHGFVVGDTVQAQGLVGTSYFGKVVCIIPAWVAPTSSEIQTYSLGSNVPISNTDRFVIEYISNKYALIPWNSVCFAVSKVSSAVQQSAPATSLVVGVTWNASHKMVDSRFPHTCTKCGNPAYIGFSSTECSKGCK